MNEYQFISRLKKKINPVNPGLALGIGDDCALINYTKASYLAVTADSFVEGVHFSRAYFTLKEAGAKAMAVNISDICAAGGVPKFAFLSIGAPSGAKAGGLTELADGCAGFGRRYGVDIAGGDTVFSEKVFISITLIGEVEKKSVMKRSGAGAGDIMFVTGPLGGAAAGRVMERKKNTGRRRGKGPLLKKHIIFEPRLREARALAKSGFVTACIDVSDGLAADTYNIAKASNKGAVINLDYLPLHPGAEIHAVKNKKPAEEAALYGGEDFELLFTVKPGQKKKFLEFSLKEKMPVFEVGRITRGRGVYLLKDGKKKKENFNRIWKHF